MTDGNPTGPTKVPTLSEVVDALLEFDSQSGRVSDEYLASLPPELADLAETALMQALTMEQFTPITAPKIIIPHPPS